MINNLRISSQIREIVLKNYGYPFSILSRVSEIKITDDVLSLNKVDEQVKIIERFIGNSIKGKKVLEIGSGFGVFVGQTIIKFNSDTYGVEPGSDGFGGSFQVSQKILIENGIDVSHIQEGMGENLPFPDNHFDIVYSTNVLEHVNDPKKVIDEAIRVCKSNGFVQIIFPNFGSFFDGHYACFYLPYQPKFLWKLWLKYVKRRNPDFVDTLRTELNYWSLKKIINEYVKANKINILSTGEEVFFERMNSQNFTAYAGLGKVQYLLRLLHKFGVVSLVTRILLLIKAHSPIILSLKKK